MTANGDDLSFLGYTDANVKFQENIYCNSTFLVVPTSRCNSVKIVNIDKEKLSKEELQHAHNLLLKHKHIFVFNEYQLGCMKDVEFKIDLMDKTPVSHRYRSIHPKYQERVQEKLKVLLETGVISETTGPWNSPLTVVEKSSGELRLCIDYRSLNKQCRRDANPIPRIEETLALLQGNTMFSTVDMMSGYYQLPLAEDSKMCTAFSAGSGNFISLIACPLGTPEVVAFSSVVLKMF